MNFLNLKNQKRFFIFKFILSFHAVEHKNLLFILFFIFDFENRPKYHKPI